MVDGFPWWVKWAFAGGVGFASTFASDALPENLTAIGFYLGLLLIFAAGGGVIWHFARERWKRPARKAAKQNATVVHNPLAPPPPPGAVVAQPKATAEPSAPSESEEAKKAKQEIGWFLKDFFLPANRALTDMIEFAATNILTNPLQKLAAESVLSKNVVTVEEIGKIVDSVPHDALLKIESRLYNSTVFYKRRYDDFSKVIGNTNSDIGGHLNSWTRLDDRMFRKLASLSQNIEYREVGNCLRVLRLMKPLPSGLGPNRVDGAQ